MTTEQVPSKELARQIRRTAEMSAEIMRDRERTGAWEGAERVARQFDRLAKLATQLESAAHEPPAALTMEQIERLCSMLHHDPIMAKDYAAVRSWFDSVRPAPPPEAWRSALVDKPTEADGPVVLVFTGEAYSVEYPADVNGVEHIAWRRITPYTRPTKGVGQ